MGQPEPDSAAEAAARSTLPPWLLRLFGRDYRPESALQKKHRQLIELIWTRGGMAERYYLAYGPTRVPFGLFVRRLTDLVCRGAQDGWIVVRLPAAPTFDDDDYGLEIADPERFVAEMEALFEPAPDEQREEAVR